MPLVVSIEDDGIKQSRTDSFPQTQSPKSIIRDFHIQQINPTDMSLVNNDSNTTIIDHNNYENSENNVRRLRSISEQRYSVNGIDKRHSLNEHMTPVGNEDKEELLDEIQARTKTTTMNRLRPIPKLHSTPNLPSSVLLPAKSGKLLSPKYNASLKTCKYGGIRLLESIILKTKA